MMRGRLARVADWPGHRPPRRTVRLKLTLLYGGLFLISGASLLALTYLLVATGFPLTVRRETPLGGVPFGIPEPSLAQVQAQGAAWRAGALHTLLTQSGIALAIMTVLSIGLGWLLAGRVLRPLRTITATARRLSATSLHERLAMTGPDDELKELGDTFDSLLARLERSFEAQRQFVANASHELRTPLARQQTLIEVALADPVPSITALQTACRRALAASEEQERLIDALLVLAHSQRGLEHPQIVDVASITRAVLESRRADADRAALRVSIALSPAVALGDAQLVERLAANLVANAIRHNVPGGWVEVHSGVQAGGAVLSVANSGVLIPAGEVGRLFQPFQRLGAARTGHRDSTGLGLSIVNAVVLAHDAQVWARALAGGGLEVRVRFPPVARPLPGQVQVDEVPAGHRGQRQPRPLRPPATGSAPVPGGR
jgi:signal transduction histidine kinase